MGFSYFILRDKVSAQTQKARQVVQVLTSTSSECGFETTATEERDSSVHERIRGEGWLMFDTRGMGWGSFTAISKLSVDNGLLIKG